MEEVYDEFQERRVFAWEGEYDRPWESLEESTTTGRLTLREDDSAFAAKRKRSLRAVQGSIKRRMLRAVLLVVDASKATGLTDVKPTRLIAVTNALITFSRAFFDENPLSSLGVVCTRNGKVERLCELTKSMRKVEDALLALQTGGASSGSATLQNCLELSMSMFNYVPNYVEREVLIVASALSVVDPGDIFTTIKTLKDKAAKDKSNIRCSTIHMCGLVEIYKRLADQTSGTFGVATGLKHLQDLLTDHITPPPSLKENALAHMVQMGFPSQRLEDAVDSLDSSKKKRNHRAQMAYCLESGQIERAPYYCPRCQAPVASLPATCRACQLSLISSSHLARSHHHLFPVDVFEDTAGKSSSSTKAVMTCYACQQGRPSHLADSVPFFSNCPKCQNAFCRYCDDLIHETLFVCPGCV